MDLVSVIIPYYRKRNFVRDSIISVIDQTYQNLEILLIYDDTNLNDFEFLKEISKLDNKIKKFNSSPTLIHGDLNNANFYKDLYNSINSRFNQIDFIFNLVG